MTAHVILGIMLVSVINVRQRTFGQLKALSQYKYFTSASLETRRHYDEFSQQPRFADRLMSISKTWTN